MLTQSALHQYPWTVRKRELMAILTGSASRQSRVALHGVMFGGCNYFPNPDDGIEGAVAGDATDPDRR